MNAPASEPNEWTTRIDQLREEMNQILKTCYGFRGENKVSIWDMHYISEAFVDTVKQAGIGLKPEDNAATYAVFRQAIHVQRKKIAELKPDLADEFNRLCPPRQQRALD